MIVYFLKRFSCNFFSVLLAFSAVSLILSSLFVGYFSSEEFIKERIDRNKTEIIAEIDSEVKSLAKVTGLKKTAFTGAVNDENFSVISDEVTKDLRYCYATDFSENTDLYNIYSASISDKSKNGGKTLKSNEVSRFASLAVATACKTLNVNGTAEVSVFNAIQQNFFVYAVIGSAGILIISIVFLELINKGRHRKYSYFGMGITLAGYILVAGTYLTQKMQYIEKHTFLEFEPYNKAIQQSVADVINKNLYIGAALIAVGLIVLLVNYNYFRKKNIKAEKEREFNKKVVTDFLEYDEPAVSHRLSDEEGFEKEVTKIDFE